jgi:DNA-3-methyladenine glycosylase I
VVQPRLPRHQVTRCPWATSELLAEYHDREWGLPVHDDRVLFEFITLEGAQAGLSWETVLRKRARYREAFAGFDPASVARYTPAKIERLLQDAGLIRHRGKIESTVANAKAVLAVQAEFGSFDGYLWGFVNRKPIVNRPRRRGFGFVGSTICYAFLQAVGMVNDHTVGCFRAAR